MNTIENDRLIVAGFMKVQVRTYTDGRTSYNPDKSWDLLMPAVEKMWKITGHRNLFYQEVSEDLTIYNKEEAGSNLRKEVYSLVVEFIKWYNQNKED